MKCPHGLHEGDGCPGCPGAIARACPDCTRVAGRCWRHTNSTVVVPPYTFRPFEPIDSTVQPFVVTPAGQEAGVVGILPGLSWAPPPAIASQVGGCVETALRQVLFS